jgi:ferredoxin
MIEQIRDICRRLLEDGVVQVVIGYGHLVGVTTPHPVFITDPAHIGSLVWSDACHHNLVRYLQREEIKALGKAAVVVKACDERALVVLEREAQIDRSAVYVVGVACDRQARAREPKCAACDGAVPQRADVVVAATGEEAAGDDAGVADAVGESADTAQRRYARLEQFLEKSPRERFAYWHEELQRCTRCYACRQVCPLCYCRQCIVDRNRPVTVESSATLQGNFSWHITRAFHLAARCIGCDACTRACPAGIDLRLLNLSLARAAETAFAYRAGCDPAAEAPVGAYRQSDREEFIR